MAKATIIVKTVHPLVLEAIQEIEYKSTEDLNKIKELLRRIRID